MPKRDREDAESSAAPAKKNRKGFSVGPENLPDGQHKRKAQQIKRNLIEKAKLKKEYAKVKAAHEAETPTAAETEASTEPHPDRQIMIDQGPRDENEEREEVRFERRRKPKAIPFQREQRRAEQAKAEAEARRKAIEDANKERQQKLEERERFRKAMAKAKTPGRDGKRKLGRESTVLLEKVRKMVGGQ
ncbi:hypothetical protein MBLNU457_7564t1 [Dothideomycetes sp. NU457]